MKSLNQMIQRVLIAYCVFDLFIHGYPCKKTENMMLQWMKKYGIHPTDKWQSNLSILLFWNAYLWSGSSYQILWTVCVLFVYTLLSHNQVHVLYPKLCSCDTDNSVKPLYFCFRELLRDCFKGANSTEHHWLNMFSSIFDHFMHWCQKHNLSMTFSAICPLDIFH